MAPASKKGGKNTKKVAAELPSIAKKGAAGKSDKSRKSGDPRIKPKNKNYSIGNDILPKRNLRPYVVWPKYVTLQRQKRIIYERMRIPPSINQFNDVLVNPDRSAVFKLLHNHRPPTKAEKKDQMKEQAKEVAKGSAPEKADRILLVHGLQEVTSLVERKQAKLVVIANNVDPIELVMWLPALCRKMDIPYCIVKSSSDLGTLVEKKRCSCVALKDINPQHKQLLTSIQDICRSRYHNRADDIRRQWGGNTKPPKVKIRSRAMRNRADREALRQSQKAGS
eukprot:TRINITY_DN41183_c0_g1_i1.p1 TRINITY_DN41183_c0_g1~~TRINITY_DN41183_c0_g1_i1.p1  ORF type:complete len:280 (+),score=27.16 TRINITY_DN41183_c0_g1_i1:95-934(+)